MSAAHIYVPREHVEAILLALRGASSKYAQMAEEAMAGGEVGEDVQAVYTMLEIRADDAIRAVERAHLEAGLRG